MNELIKTHLIVTLSRNFLALNIYGRYFGHFNSFGGYLVILECLEYFRVF